MIKLAIEMSRKSNLTGQPCLRVIVFEQTSDPAIQDTAWWMVQDIFEYDATNTGCTFASARVSDLLSHITTPEGCDSITIAPQEPNIGNTVINTWAGTEPTEPYVHAVLKAIYTTWANQVDPFILKKEGEAA